MKTFASVVFIVALMGALGAKRAITNVHIKEVGQTVLITGWLGHPIGETVTIKGYKRRNGPYADTFVVEYVNGTAQSALISIPGTATWPEKTKATLKGAEVAEIRFSENVNGPPFEKFTPQQTSFITFEVENVIEPQNLKLDKGPTKRPARSEEEQRKLDDIFK